MTWYKSHLIYQLKSPLYIGFRPFWFIMRTRYYVPARVLWAAFTKELTELLQSEYRARDYEAVGKVVNEHVRFSYFFISDGNGHSLQPHYEKEQGFCMGDLTAVQFEERYIRSYASTAIDPQRFAAMDEMLHEVEYICPRIQDSRGRLHDTFIEGDIYINSDFICRDKRNIIYNGQEIELREILTRFRLGGEQTYGFGRLEMKRMDDFKEGPPKHEVDNPEEYVLPAHLGVEKAKDVIRSFSGDVEMLFWRTWEKGRGAGQGTGFLGLALAPGTRVSLDCEQLLIGYYGIIEPK